MPTPISAVRLLSIDCRNGFIAGLRLILDFVANHTAPDHPWVAEHPKYYVPGTEAELATQPPNYTRIRAGDRERILAYGRDPYFAGWPDTVQLNYGNPQFREALCCAKARR